MTVYAPTGTTGISVGSTGHAHQTERELGPGEHFAVQCPECETLILATKTGWASDVTSVALTPDERAVYEQQEKVGQRAQAIASRALAERLGDLIRTDGMVAAAPVDPVQDVIGKLAALSDDQLAVLRGIFASDQAAAADATPKRGPGRPKKIDSAE
jgi:hypothetical protein